MTEPEPPEADTEARARLDEVILGHRPTMTRDEVSEAAGIPVAEARRLWRALGFPDVGDAPAFTEADLRMLRELIAAARSGPVDFDTTVRLTRAVGQTMARLADWQVSTMAGVLEELERRGEVVEPVAGGLQLAEATTELFEHLMVYAWRRHLAASVVRREAVRDAEEEEQTVHVSVGFADLVAFTALSNELDEERLGELVEIFESRCADVVATHHGRVIKTLGDSVLFVSEDPLRAMEIALGIIELIGADTRLPDVHVGLATGSVVTRMGDVFGPPVNMAARLTGVARRNRVIVDQVTADLLPPDQFEVRPLTARPVRGFGLVEPFAVRRL